MSVLLKGMQIQARQLDTVSARIAADNCIQDLSKFIVALAEEVPQSSFTGACVTRLLETLAHEPSLQLLCRPCV